MRIPRALTAGLGLVGALHACAPAAAPAPEAPSGALPPPTPQTGGTIAEHRWETVHLEEAVILDRIRGAWIGQMIGVTWGAPTEFYARYNYQHYPEIHQVDGEPGSIYAQYEGGIIPIDELPEWDPELINDGYDQDDLYVEVPFLEAMREHGVNCGWPEFGNAFRDTEFQLWHANNAGRENLRKGIPAPESGHYSNNLHADDIDWQIEADFVGLTNPAQPHSAADIAWRAGHVMNYGDGVYGGVFVATMIATAFTAEDVGEVIEAGRQAVPQGSEYRALIEQVIESHQSGKTWDQTVEQLLEDWGTDDKCEEWAGDKDPLNIDAKLNGSYVLLGLLYGDGDLAQSIRISMAAGQDSDCNPSNAGSVLGALYGFERIQAMEGDWVSALDETRKFQTTPYTLDELVQLNLDLAREVVELKGGTAPEGGTWEIPTVQTRIVPLLEQWPDQDDAPPALEASAVVETGRTVRFAAEASDDDGIRAFQWYFGDLTFADGSNGTHTYRQPGTYRAICYVTDEGGNTSYEQVEITVE